MCCPDAPGLFLHLLCLLCFLYLLASAPLCLCVSVSPWLPFSFDVASALCQYPERLEFCGLRATASRFGSPFSLPAARATATLLETERTTLLIDAGLGKKEMLRRFEALGRARPERVDAILITHEHSDHSSGLAQMAREWDCPAYLTEPTHREILKMYADDPEKPGRKAKMERVRVHSRGRALRDWRHRNQSVRDPARRRRSGRLRLPHQRHESRDRH